MEYMDYPHYTFGRKAKAEAKEEKTPWYKHFRPKMLGYIGVALSATMYFYFGFEHFLYIAIAFFIWGLYHMVTCGCWKAQLRTAAGSLMLLLALGLVWKPVFALAVSIMAFEMFV